MILFQTKSTHPIIVFTCIKYLWRDAQKLIREIKREREGERGSEGEREKEREWEKEEKREMESKLGLE